MPKKFHTQKRILWVGGGVMIYSMQQKEEDSKQISVVRIMLHTLTKTINWKCSKATYSLNSNILMKRKKYDNEY